MPSILRNAHIFCYSSEDVCWALAPYSTGYFPIDQKLALAFKMVPRSLNMLFSSRLPEHIIKTKCTFRSTSESPWLDLRVSGSCACCLQLSTADGQVWRNQHFLIDRIYFIWETKRELPKYPQQLRLGWAKAMSWEPNPGLPLGWQRPNSSALSYCLPRGMVSES